MKEFRDYDIHHPQLIVELLEYFDTENESVRLDQKTVIDFCCKFNNSNCTISNEIQPNIIVKICDILCQNNLLLSVTRDGIFGSMNNYAFIMNDRNSWKLSRDYYINSYNSLVYGFEYVYKIYKDIVLPIIACDNKGQQYMGTCFKFHKGIVTARHCLTDGCKIMIKGYSAKTLNKAIVYVSKNRNVDIAYIHLNEETQIFATEPKVLDEVLVMGYPMIPRFLGFCTAEKATISTIANLRMTPSRGSIAAIADEMFTKDVTELMLITAKIKGGNSGGPVINKDGCVVGVSFSDAKGEGESYDDLGYGIACPISILDKVVAERETLDVTFVDFEE